MDGQFDEIGPVTTHQATASRPPRIAVLVPAYNAQAKLERTLASIDAQDDAFDIFVVDDGSDPPVVLDPARFRHTLRLFRLAANGGIAIALNEGLRIIMAEDYDLVARHDCGDVDLGPRIARQARAMIEDPSLGIVGCWTDFVEPSGTSGFVYRTPVDSRAIANRMHYGPAFIHPACMIRVDALRRVGLYSREFPHAEDYDLFFRIIRAFPSRNLPEVLVATELNPSGISISARRAALVSRMRIQLRYFRPGSPHAWLGLLRSMLFYFIPNDLLLGVKRRRKTVR